MRYDGLSEVSVRKGNYTAKPVSTEMRDNPETKIESAGIPTVISRGTAKFSTTRPLIGTDLERESPHSSDSALACVLRTMALIRRGSSEGIR